MRDKEKESKPETVTCGTAPHYHWDLTMIKDLIDPTDKIRMSGRTTVLAHAYIQLAQENPDLEIQIRDHFPNPNSDMFLGDKISTIVNSLNEDMIKHCYRTRFVVLRLENKPFIVYTTHPDKYGKEFKR